MGHWLLWRCPAGRRTGRQGSLLVWATTPWGMRGPLCCCARTCSRSVTDNKQSAHVSSQGRDPHILQAGCVSTRHSVLLIVGRIGEGGGRGASGAGGAGTACCSRPVCCLRQVAAPHLCQSFVHLVVHAPQPQRPLTPGADGCRLGRAGDLHKVRPARVCRHTGYRAIEVSDLTGGVEVCVHTSTQHAFLHVWTGEDDEWVQVAALSHTPTCGPRQQKLVRLPVTRVAVLAAPHTNSRPTTHLQTSHWKKYLAKPCNADTSRAPPSLLGSLQTRQAAAA